MFAIFGAGGQWLYNRADARHMAQEAEGDSGQGWQRILDSKWSPMKVLTDEDYERMLHEKLLNINARIAMIDDQKAALEARKQANVLESESQQK